MSEVEAVTTSQVKLLPEVQPTPEPLTSSRNPIRWDRVKFLSSIGGEFSAEIISRAGKANGKYKFHYNVQYDDPTKAECVNLTPADFNWKYDENSLSVSALATMSVVDEFADARETELKSWKNFEVFDIVEDVRQPRITTRGVYTTKQSGQKEARIVARGFEDPEYNNLVKHSPTCSKEGFRAAVTIVAWHESWRCSAVDVKTAFLQGFPLKREVNLEPPKPHKIQTCGSCENAYTDWSMLREYGTTELLHKSTILV